MADTHYEVNEALYHARQLAEPVRRLKTERDRLLNTFAIMSTMKDGDGSQASHFQKVVDLFGVQGADGTAQLANAKAIYDELNSWIGNEHASQPQMLARLG